jgi:hypothetical protein
LGFLLSSAARAVHYVGASVADARQRCAGAIAWADGVAERAVGGIESRLRRLAERADKRVTLLGQSRGGELARVAASATRIWSAR